MEAVPTQTVGHARLAWQIEARAKGQRADRSPDRHVLFFCLAELNEGSVRTTVMSSEVKGWTPKCPSVSAFLWTVTGLPIPTAQPNGLFISAARGRNFVCVDWHVNFLVISLRQLVQTLVFSSDWCVTLWKPRIANLCSYNRWSLFYLCYWLWV